ncbi:SRPBCC domain-containing protein [Chryseobacterium soli]|nr:SRPBCC domain-containing protein [Chryseobacterium soli]
MKYLKTIILTTIILTIVILITLLNTTVMEKEIKTEILINSTPEKSWSILTNFDNYPNWNPFIKSIKGEVKVGNKITVTIEPPESKGMTFNPKILTFKKDKELSWLGHLLFAGLFDGEHKFELIDNGNGTITFRQSEKFKGILVPLFKKQLDNNTKRGFEEMNKKLKELAEQK